MSPMIIPMAFKASLALIQNAQANKLEKSTERPMYQIPDAALQSLKQARYMAASSKMPGQDQAIDLMNANTSNAAYNMIQATDNPNQVVENIARMSQNNNRTIQQMNISGANMQRENQMSLRNELKYMASLEREKYNYDVIQPYQEKMLKAQQMKEAARQNGYDVLRTGAQLGAMGEFGKLGGFGQTPGINPNNQQVDFDQFMSGDFMQGNYDGSTSNTV